MKRLKVCVLCIIGILFFNRLDAQISIKTDLSFGVNYATSYRRHINNPAIEKTLPTHSYSVAVYTQYAFLDSAYLIGIGFGFLKRPVVFVLIDQDLSTYSEECDLSSMVFGYNSFYRKQKYYFLDFPIYFKRQFSNGLGLIAGLTFKYYCKNLTEVDRIFERLVFKDFNWSPILGVSYAFNKHLSLMLKAEPEYIPFIKTPDLDRITFVANFNTMLSIGYKFNFK